MAKSSWDELLHTVFLIAGVFAGVKVVEDVLTPKANCPRCRARIKVGAPKCPSCGAAITWRKREHVQVR